MELRNCKVVMLPTEKADNAIIKHANGLLELVKFYMTQSWLEHRHMTSYHLYVIDENYIDSYEDVLYIDKNTNQIMSSGGAQYGGKQDIIIATSDMDLIMTHNRKLAEDSIEDSKKRYGVGRIPTSFVTAFTESNGKINEVKAEFVEVEIEGGTLTISKKRRDDNTIVVHLSNSYTEEDLLAAAMVGYSSGYADRDANQNTFHGLEPKEYFKYLEENL